jgi:uncharacterized protein (DUF433 family)
MLGDKGNRGIAAMTRNELITQSKDILGGAPVFAGTRVPVQTLLDYLKGGERLDDFLDDFPSVTRAQAEALLEVLKESLVSAK